MLFDINKNSLYKETAAKLIVSSKQKNNSVIINNKKNLDFILSSGNDNLKKVFNISSFIFFTQILFDYLKPSKNWLVNSFEKYIESYFSNLDHWISNEIIFFKNFIQFQVKFNKIQIDQLIVFPEQILPCYNQISNSQKKETIVAATQDEKGNIEYFTDEGKKLAVKKILGIQRNSFERDLIQIGAYDLSLKANFAGLEPMRRCLNYKQNLEFCNILDQSLSFIHQYGSEEIKRNLKLINSIVPCQVDTESYPSGSTYILPHSIFLKINDNFFMTCEMLVHETSHVALNFKNFTNKIINCECKKTSNIFYSPWRDDSRPLNGIIHGLYVFLNVSKFWHQVISKNLFSNIEEEDISVRRYHTLASQLKKAIDQELPFECLSDFGKKLLNQLIKEVKDLEYLDKECLTNKKVLYAENHSQWNFSSDKIAFAIQKHQQSWVKSL